MRPVLLSISLVLVLAAAWAGITGYRPSPVITPDAALADPLTPTRLLQLAVLCQPENPERADVLAHAAVDRVIHQPTSLASFWAFLSKYLADQDGTHQREKLAQLLLFEGALESAVVHCQSEEQLTSVWQVSRDVRAAAEESRDRIVNSVAQDACAALSSSASDLNLLLRQVADKRENWERLLGAAVSKPPTKLQSTAIDSLQKSTTHANQAIRAQVDKLTDEVAQLGTASAAETVQPVADGVGVVQKAQSEVDHLSQALESSGWEAWQQFIVEQTKSQAAIEPKTIISEQLANLAQEAAAVQQLRYNLWAVQQIATADGSDAWDRYLGRIDLGVLRPSTAALFSLTYEKCIRETSGAQAQAEAVQRILKSSKQSLISF